MRKQMFSIAAVLVPLFCFLGAGWGVTYAPFCWNCFSMQNVKPFTYWYGWGEETHAAWQKLWECTHCKKLWKPSEPWNRDEYVWNGTEYKVVNERKSNPMYEIADKLKNK